MTVSEKDGVEATPQLRHGPQHLEQSVVDLADHSIRFGDSVKEFLAEGLGPLVVFLVVFPEVGQVGEVILSQFLLDFACRDLLLKESAGEGFESFVEFDVAEVEKVEQGLSVFPFDEPRLAEFGEFLFFELELEVLDQRPEGVLDIVFLAFGLFHHQKVVDVWRDLAVERGHESGLVAVLLLAHDLQENAALIGFEVCKFRVQRVFEEENRAEKTAQSFEFAEGRVDVFLLHSVEDSDLGVRERSHKGFCLDNREQ